MPSRKREVGKRQWCRNLTGAIDFKTNEFMLLQRHASDWRESDTGRCENKNLWAVIQWTCQSQTMHIDHLGFPGINNEMSSRNWLASADFKGDKSGVQLASHHRRRNRNYLGRHGWIITFVSFCFPDKLTVYNQTWQKIPTFTSMLKGNVRSGSYNLDCSVFGFNPPSWAFHWATLACTQKHGFFVHLLLRWYIWRCEHKP